MDLKFINLGVTPRVNRIFLPSNDDGTSEDISIPNRFLFGNTSQTSLYVCSIHCWLLHVRKHYIIELYFGLFIWQRLNFVTKHSCFSYCRFPLMVCSPLADPSHSMMPIFSLAIDSISSLLHSGLTLTSALEWGMCPMKYTHHQMRWSGWAHLSVNTSRPTSQESGWL